MTISKRIAVLLTATAFCAGARLWADAIPAEPAAEPPAEPEGPDVVIDESELEAPTVMLLKPAKFKSWSERFDFIHNNVQLKVQSGISRADTFFAGQPVDAVPPAETRFRVGFYTQFEVDKGPSLSIDPNFDADIELPNLERRWKVFLNTEDLNELPGTDPTEREGGATIGLSNKSKLLNIYFDAGVRTKWLPVGFLRVKWSPEYRAGDWTHRPRAQGTYETDRGLGALSSYSVYRWFGGRKRGLAQSVSAVKWTEEPNKTTWEQTLMLSYLPELLQARHVGRAVHTHESARGIGLRYSIFGRLDDEGDPLDRHRFTVTYRQPAYKDWVYWEIAPEFEYRYDYNDEEWDTITSLRIGLDMLFWGVRR